MLSPLGVLALICQNCMVINIFIVVANKEVVSSEVKL